MNLIILDANNEPKIATFPEWEAWHRSKPDKLVALDYIGPSIIRTELIDSLPDDSTNWWETSVLFGRLHLNRTTCSGGREQAQAQHEEMARKVRAAEKKEAI